VDGDGRRSSNMIAASSPNSFSWWSRIAWISRRSSLEASSLAAVARMMKPVNSSSPNSVHPGSALRHAVGAEQHPVSRLQDDDVDLAGPGRGELAGQAHRRLGRRRELGLRHPRPRHRDLHSGPAAHRAAHRTPNDAFDTAAIIHLVDYHQ
jgi:hypothetical protein